VKANKGWKEIALQKIKEAGKNSGGVKLFLIAGLAGWLERPW
jgi:hypothetical protein